MDRLTSRKDSSRVAGLVAVVYLSLGLAWVIGTDILVSSLVDNRLAAHLQTAKGAGFILLSTLLLFLWLRRTLKAYAGAVREHRRHEADLEFTLRASRGGIWEFVGGADSTDVRQGTMRLSPALKTLLGYAPEELPDDTPTLLGVIHPDDLPRVIAAATECLSGQRDEFNAVYRVRHKSGALRWVQARARIEHPGSGRPQRWIGVMLDVHEQESARAQAALLGQLFETSPEGVLLADPERKIITVNAAFQRLSGYSAEELVGRSLDQVLFAHQPRDVFDAVQRELDRYGRWTGLLDCVRRNGQPCRAEVRISMSRDREGKIAQYGALVFDITELESSRSELAFLQNYDALTRLPNAQLIQHHLSEALRRAIRTRTGLVVLAIGLDRFHLINEAFGRPVGDKLLAMVGERLVQARDATSYVGRLHGDRFVLLVEHVTDQQEMERLVERARAALEPHAVIDGQTLHLSASIGVARFPLDGVTAEQLLQRAESALEDAKRSGGLYRLYRAELSDIASDRVHIETNLRRALIEGGFECHFQPQVRLESGAWTGAEALIRWRLGDCWISPARFIPIAEQSGLIKDLGRWMLWEAASKVSQWRDQQVVAEDFQVAVNLASAQLEPELPQIVRGILNFNRLGAEQLVLELTENIIMSNPTAVAELLRELRGMGVYIALDDFGAGNTSLSQLHALPLDELKLDRTFVAGLPSDRSSMAIARSVIALAEALKLRVVAEGIETEAQREALISLGCRYGQGHLFAAAMPAAHFEEQLRARPRPATRPHELGDPR